MNREQKIALILGFAVILVVGVLVSDHWSAAQRLDLADATEGDLGRVEAMPVAMLPDPGGETTRLTAGPATGETVGQQSQLESAPAQADPLTIALGGNGEVSPLGFALEQFVTPVGEFQAQPADREGLFDRLNERLAEGFGNGVPAAARIDDAGEPPVSGRQLEPQVREVPPTAPVRHTVAQNESLYKIAALYLGNGNRWREIAAANAGKVGPDGSVRSGVTLVIPNPSAKPTQTTRPSIGRPTETRVAETPAPTKPVTYTVAKNDSLGEISRRFLGSSKLTHLIVRANPGKISDPDDIRVGMVLTIPARS